MGWFARWKKRAAPMVVVSPPPDVDDWLTVPFRFAEAARVSMHTISRQPEVPAPVRFWIMQWLDSYNYSLVAFMKEKYGPEVLTICDRITDEVVPDDGDSMGDGPPWDRWERQLSEDQ